MKKINLNDLKQKQNVRWFNESEFDHHINNIFSFWDWNQMNSI